MGSERALPLRRGDRGDAVRDLQGRLVAAGFPCADEAGTYGDHTVAAVTDFQISRRLAADGVCGNDTWAALVEAGFHPGDRLLYLRRPMLRGDDVADLQLKLGALGFDTGRVDGIFGPDTEQAVREFQRNVGATVDGICGPEVLGALSRLGSWADADEVVASVRERHLSTGHAGLAALRVAVGQQGGLEAVAREIRRALTDRGALVHAADHLDPSAQAADANAFGADVYVGFSVNAGVGARVAFYATAGFVSSRGRRLAELLAAELADAAAEGMRLPILRETKMPAVLCQVRTAGEAADRADEIIAASITALERWAREPLDPRA